MTWWRRRSDYPPTEEMEKIQPFVNAAHWASYDQATRINPRDAVTVVNDLINYCRAQDAGRRNNYNWSDEHMVNSLRIKLNVWILSKIGQPELPVTDRPLNGSQDG